MTTPDGSAGPSMLLSVRTRNTRSFRDGFELSMLATSLSRETVTHRVPRTADGRTTDVLPVAGIFGANASGKSQLLMSVADIRSAVLESFRDRVPGLGVSKHAFALEAEARGRPSSADVELVLGGVEHHYGYEISDDEVLHEYAVAYPKGRPATLFERVGPGEVRFGARDRREGRAALSVLRPDALFLSTAAATGHPSLSELYGWFSRNLVLMNQASRSVRQRYTASMVEAGEQRDRVLDLLRAADLGIVDVNTQRVEVDPEIRRRMAQAVQIMRGEHGPPVDPEDIPLNDLLVELVHEGVDDAYRLPEEEESLGTLVWMGLVGPVVDALDQGSVLLADELDSSLHPALVRRLVELFQDPHRNPRHAQIVFNAHDTTLLPGSADEGPLGRDQVWFTEKFGGGVTRLTSLIEFGPRRDEAVRRRYEAGSYGARPNLIAADFDPLDVLAGR